MLVNQGAKPQHLEPSSQHLVGATDYGLLTNDYSVEFAWLGTREDAAHHLHTLIEPSTFDHERWMKEQKAFA